jgi:hypothetical protein
MRFPRPLADRVRAFIDSKSEGPARLTFSDAVRYLVDRGLADATRVRGGKR